VTFVTLECVRACVWLLPSLRSVGACVWECGPGCRSGSSLYIYVPCVLTYFSFAVASSTHHTSIDHGAPGSCTVRAVDGALVERAARALDEAAPLDVAQRSARAVQGGCRAGRCGAVQRPVFYSLAKVYFDKRGRSSSSSSRTPFPVYPPKVAMPRLAVASESAIVCDGERWPPRR
jgi:hypothetical protein